MVPYRKTIEKILETLTGYPAIERVILYGSC